MWESLYSRAEPLHFSCIKILLKFSSAFFVYAQCLLKRGFKTCQQSNHTNTPRPHSPKCLLLQKLRCLQSKARPKRTNSMFTCLTRDGWENLFQHIYQQRQTETCFNTATSQHSTFRSGVSSSVWYLKVSMLYKIHGGFPEFLHLCCKFFGFLILKAWHARHATSSRMLVILSPLCALTRH